MVYDIDVSTPEELPAILRNASEAFVESHETLKSAWQDKKAGKVWARIALILETAADKIEREVQKQ